MKINKDYFEVKYINVYYIFTTVWIIKMNIEIKFCNKEKVNWMFGKFLLIASIYCYK